MKTLSVLVTAIMLLSGLLALPLFSGGVLMIAHAATPSPSDGQEQQIALTLSGEVVDAGSQHYLLHQDGHVASAFLLGYSIGPLTSSFDYRYNVNVKGLTADGNANFHLHGVIVGGSYDGWIVDFSGDAKITGLVPAICLPDYDLPDANGNCPQPDSSTVPMFFVGEANHVLLKMNSPGQRPVSTQLTQVPMLFESAYFDPFGHPVFLGTPDVCATVPCPSTSISIITAYTQGSIDWKNVVSSGIVSGTLDQLSVSGSFTQVASEKENLVLGTAKDDGKISFSSMTDSSGNGVDSLDAQGPYKGTSTIPSSTWCGTFVCQTGFQSQGSFNIHTDQDSEHVGGRISGTYSIAWSTPALTFTGNVVDEVLSTDQQK